MDQIIAMERTPELEAHLLPLQVALADLPEMTLAPDGAVRLKNGNPGRVLAGDAAPGDLAWGSFEGQPVAVGTYIGGELHPNRVFNL